MENKYYTYIILTQDNTLYCGYTDNLEKRFEKHMSGKGAKYTRSHKPVKIVYSACFDTKIEAQQEERRIKKMSRAQKQAFLDAEMQRSKEA